MVEVRFRGPLPEAIRHLDRTAPKGLHLDTSNREQLRVVVVEVLGDEKRFLIKEQR